MGNASNISLKDIFHLLSKPLKIVFSIITTITGSSFIGFFVCLFIVFEEIHKTETIQINSSWVIALIVLASIAFFGACILALLSVIALLRNKYDSQVFNDNCVQFNSNCEQCLNNSNLYTETLSKCNDNVNLYENNINELNKIYSSFVETSDSLHNIAEDIKKERIKNVLSKFILDEHSISDLESSVLNECRIVVLTSQFHLDRGKLLQLILDNIRKGIHYEYLIANNNKDHYNFVTVYNLWWKTFLSNLFEPSFFSEREESFSNEYKKLRTNALNAKEDSKRNRVIEQAKEYFISHVSEYSVGMEHRLVTIIMYQQKPSSPNNWKIIIKLPTQSDDDYYAFQVPDSENIEKSALINSIEDYIKIKQKIVLELKDCVLEDKI